MRSFFAGLTFLALAACFGGEGTGLGSGLDLSKTNKTASAPERLLVARGDVAIAGPPGYCIDKASSRTGLGAAPFVVLASCSSVTGSAEAGQPGSPGLLTALVDQRLDVTPSPEDLQAFLQTEAGRASLARDGRASSVEVLETNILKNALLLRIRDKSEATAPSLATTYWRGLFAINNRLVTVTATAFEARPIDSGTLKGKLVAFIAKIREETPTKDQDTGQTAAPFQGLLNRLRQ